MMEMNIDDLKAPIGVFDAGLGSYAAAEKIRRSHPQQDIVYLADRASFPYGSKSKSELSAAVFSAISFLARVGCSAVVLASNAPSVMVLEELRHSLPVPVLGVYPPIALAIERSLSKQVGILGVASLVESLEMKEFLKQHGYGGSLSVFNASPLVALVEDGSFLTEKEATQNAVRLFLESCWSEKPELDTFTLSSTHLPWLLDFFQKAAPGVTFLDPLTTCSVS